MSGPNGPTGSWNPKPGNLAGVIYLEQLHDSNETLDYKLIAEHVTELLTIVNDPTGAEAIEKRSHGYRRLRGVYLVHRPPG